MTTTPVSTALLLCGALAREVMAIVRKHDWQADCVCISAQEHMRPQRIAPLVEQKLQELMPQYERVIVVYGDCGTGGELDKVLTRYNIPRIAGPHCYEMYGGKTHDVLMEEQPGTFFLTDFLLRGFDGMVWKGLGLDRFPELRDDYFGNYTRLVYLVQIEDPVMLVKAQQVSQKMGLPLEVRHTGYGELENRLALLMNADGVAPTTISSESHKSRVISPGPFGRHISRARTRDS